MISIYLWVMCIYLGMNIEHESIWSTIYCVHIYVHSIALWALGGLSAGIPPVYIQFYFARLRSTREARVYYPQYVLTVFLFIGFRSVRYVLPDYVGLGPKLHTCIYLQFMCITCLWMQQVIKILFSVSVKSSI